MNWSEAPKIYIAGPYSGDTENNIKRANEAAYKLMEIGYIPVIPHNLYRHWELVDIPGIGYQDYLDITFEYLKWCDCIYMLSRWKESNGAIQEHDYAAYTMNIPVYYQGMKEPEDT